MTTVQEVEDFKSHAVWRSFEAALTILGNATGHSSTDRHTIARAIAVMNYVNHYRSLSPYLFPTTRLSALQEINQNVVAIVAQLEAWDRADSMLANTISNIDQSLDQISLIPERHGWPSLQKESRAAAISETAEAFRIASEGSLDALEQSVLNAQESLTALDARVELLNTEAEARGLEATASLEALESTQADSAALLKAKLTELLETLEKAADQQREQIQTDASTSLAQLDSDAERGKKLLSYIGDQSVGGGYDKFAAKEKIAYRFWMGLGIVAVVATLGYLAYEFTQIKELTAATAILKGTLSVTALGFSTFAFREAGKRSRQAVEAKYRALDLLALRPYTDEMDDTQTAKLRFLLGERLFGARVDAAGANSPDGGQLTLSVDDATRIVALLKSLKDMGT